MNWDDPKISSLLTAIVAIQDTAEARSFFRDLLTEKELNEFANRWKAAQMLNNRVPYTQIVDETGLSSATVARISKWLNNGTGGYQSMLEKLQEVNQI